MRPVPGREQQVEAAELELSCVAWAVGLLPPDGVAAVTHGRRIVRAAGGRIRRKPHSRSVGARMERGRRSPPQKPARRSGRGGDGGGPRAADTDRMLEGRNTMSIKNTTLLVV